MRVRKWYLASNVHGMNHFFDQIQALVLSCRANTALSMHFIFDDEGTNGIVEQRVQWLLDRDVTVIRHKASIVKLLLPIFPERMSIYGGHWLRCDVPDIETEEQVVLYTDIDTIFFKEIPEIAIPDYVSCGPELQIDDYSYFSSGVMLINVPTTRLRRCGDRLQ